MPDTPNTITQGWVYLIVNDINPSRVKIGFTTRDPIERAYDLISTGTFGTFVVIYQALVHEPYRVEQTVHRRLADLNQEREWFEVCPNRAKEEIRAAAGVVLYENTSPRWHPSQPAPADRTKELLDEARKAAEEARREEARRVEEEAAARARQAEEEAAARARQAKEEAAARRAAENARMMREREAEQERRRLLAEQEKRWAEEQAALAARRERARLRNALIRKTILAAASWLVAIVAGGAVLCVVITQIGQARDRRIAEMKSKVDRLTSDLQQIRSTLAERRSDVARLSEELRDAKKRQQVLRPVIFDYEVQLIRARAAREVHRRKVDAPKNLPSQDFDRAQNQLLDDLERHRRRVEDAERELSAAKDALALAERRTEAIPREIAELEEQIQRLSEKQSVVEGELGNARRAAGPFISESPSVKPGR